MELGAEMGFAFDERGAPRGEFDHNLWMGGVILRLWLRRRYGLYGWVRRAEGMDTIHPVGALSLVF